MLVATMLDCHPARGLRFVGPPKRLTFPLLLFAFSASCVPSVSRFSSATAPSDLKYTTNPAVYLRAQAIVPNPPEASGGTVTLFTVSPVLPPGLVLDQSSGIISGTPTSTVTTAVYKVTASNSYGQTSVDLTLAVSDVAPANLTYAQNPLKLQRTTPMTADVPTTQSGQATLFAIAPALPDGLDINTSTGVISGTPSLVQAEQNYTVTAQNGFGATTATLNITVADVPPTLSYPQSTYTFVLNQLASTGVPVATGGAITGCTPATGVVLPAGLSVDPGTCEIAGVPTVLAAQASYVLAVSYVGGVEPVPIMITINGALAMRNSTVTLTSSSNTTYAFTALGGQPPYVFHLLSGPGTLTLDGVFTAGTQALPAIVEVSDSGGATAVATVTHVLQRTDGQISSIVQDGASLYLGGPFYRVNPSTAPGLLRIDTVNHQADFGFDVGDGVYGGASLRNSVFAMALSDSSIYIGGNILGYRNTTVQNLVKIDRTTGELDTNFTHSLGFDGAVTALAVDGNSLFVGGQFQHYRDTPTGFLAKIDATSGALDASFNPNSGFVVTNTAQMSNMVVHTILPSAGTLYVGGYFPSGAVSYVDPNGNTLTAAQMGHLLRIDEDTGALVLSGTIGSGVTTSGCGSDCSGGYFCAGVEALISVGNLLCVGGAFYQFNATNIDGFTCFDPSATSPTPMLFAPTGGIGTADDSSDDQICAFATDGTSLYTVGNFSQAGGLARNDLAKFTVAAGTVDPTFDPGAGVTVAETIALDGNQLYVGGTHYNGTATAGLFTLSTTDASLVTPPLAAPGLDCQFHSSCEAYVMAVDSGLGGLFIAGDFVGEGGSAVSQLAKVSVDNGLVDANFVPSSLTGNTNEGEVNALAVGEAGLYVGGYFNNDGSDVACGLAKLDKNSGVLDTTFTSQAVCSAGTFLVDSLLLDGSTNGPNGAPTLYVSGAFSQYRGAPVGGLIALSPSDGSLAANFAVNTDGGFNGEVNTVGLYNSGSNHSLFAGGSFTTLAGTAAGNIAKIDLPGGNLDGTFNHGAAGFTGFVGSPSHVSVLAAANTDSVGMLYMGVSALHTYNGVTLQNESSQIDGLVVVDPTTGALDSNCPNSNAPYLQMSNSIVTGIALGAELIPRSSPYYPETVAFLAGQFQPYPAFYGNQAPIQPVDFVKLDSTPYIYDMPANTCVVDSPFFANQSLGSFSDLVVENIWYIGSTVYVSGALTVPPSGRTSYYQTLDPDTGLIQP